MKKKGSGVDYIGVGGGILIFNDKKEVLLLQRSKNARNEAGWWQKPGGCIEFGEKAEVAMKREVLEETGLRVDIIGYLPHTDHIIKKEKEHWLAVNYIATVRSGTARVMEPEKCDRLAWFPLSRLPKKINQTTRESIKNYLAKKYIRR